MRIRIALIVPALAFYATIATAQQLGVELVGQQRHLHAYAFLNTPREPELQESSDVGPFSGRLAPQESRTDCGLGHCISISASIVAEQDSTISLSNGVLDVRGIGSVSPGLPNFGTIGAESALSVIFRTRSRVPYLLLVELTNGASFELKDDEGVIINHQHHTGVIDDTGELWAGWMYTLTVQANGGGFNLRFATGPSPSDRITCTPRLSQTSYQDGEMVRATEMRVGNSYGRDVAIEMKLWLRMLDGAPVSAFNLGSDGSFVIPRGVAPNYGPFDIFPVTTAIERGYYELGCRLLEPSTGRTLHESTVMFRVR